MEDYGISAPAASLSKGTVSQPCQGWAFIQVLSTWVLLPREGAQVRAGKALSASMAVLFLPLPDAAGALGLEGWVTAHWMPPGSSSPCCQA